MTVRNSITLWPDEFNQNFSKNIETVLVPYISIIPFYSS